VKLSFLCILLGLLGAAPCVAGPVLVPLEAVMEKGQPQTRAAPDGKRQASVMQPLADAAMATSLAAEAKVGATAFALELDAMAQRVAGSTQLAPIYLFLSLEEGGFARRGFWLQEPGGRLQWHEDPYVDLIVDARSIEDGSFEEIFAHELGHALLRRLLGSLPFGYSRNRHASIAVTDYPTAFDEGFATHFQALARLLTRNPQLRAQDAGTSFKPFLPYWRDNIDRNLRVRGVRDNLFVQHQAPWPASPTPGNPDATTLFDTTQLKNGQQMMASEGVIATLFYHLMTQGVAITPDDTAALRTRYEELFRALQALGSTTSLKSDTPIFLSVAQQFMAQTPAARSRWAQTIIGITYGATVERALPQQAEGLSLASRTGNDEEFVEQLGAARKAMAALVQRVESNPRLLTAALGSEIWMAGEAGGMPVNVNTAERDSLVLLLKLDASVAERALQSRRQQGLFQNVADFSRRAGLNAAQAAQLAASGKAIIGAGPNPRE